jgi:hypothetical protein
MSLFVNGWVKLATFEDHCMIKQAAVGDLIRLSNGHLYKLTRKTLTAAAVKRWYWWNKLWDVFFEGEAKDDNYV